MHFRMLFRFILGQYFISSYMACAWGFIWEDKEDIKTLRHWYFGLSLGWKGFSKNDQDIEFDIKERTLVDHIIKV